MRAYTVEEAAGVLEIVTAAERAIAGAAFRLLPETFGPRARCDIVFVIQPAPRALPRLLCRAKPASVLVWDGDTGKEGGPVFALDLKAAGPLHFSEDVSYWLRAGGCPEVRDEPRAGRAAKLREYMICAVNELARGRKPAPGGIE